MKDINIGKINKNVGQRVKERRISLGLSRAEVAKMVGISQQQFEKYEKGLNRISAGMLAAIAQHFEVEPGYFFDEIKSDYNTSSSAHQRLALELSRNFLKIENPKHQKLVMITTSLLSENS